MYSLDFSKNFLDNQILNSLLKSLTYSIYWFIITKKISKEIGFCQQIEGNKSEDVLFFWNPYILKTWNSYQLFFDDADRAEKPELSFKIFKPLLKLSSKLENVILFDVFQLS